MYHAGPEWTWEQWQWRGAPYSSSHQHYLDLTIRLFSVLSGHSLGGSYPSAKVQSVYSTAPPQPTGQNKSRLSGKLCRFFFHCRPNYSHHPQQYQDILNFWSHFTSNKSVTLRLYSVYSWIKINLLWVERISFAIFCNHCSLFLFTKSFGINTVC